MKMSKMCRNYAFDFLDAGLALDEGLEAGFEADLGAAFAALGFEAAVFAAV